MKNLIATLIVAGFCFTALQARTANEEVEKIRKDYNIIKTKIDKLKQDGYAGALYCIHVEDNVHGKSYPASGTYNVQYWFYYDLGEDGNAELKW